ncbi:MAG: HAMP domain-containing histidine kinase [Atopobiaceae bacterium]|nr:HAMP domain-containing histidine kinase [Atopobiaceae bacterium]
MQEGVQKASIEGHGRFEGFPGRDFAFVFVSTDGVEHRFLFWDYAIRYAPMACILLLWQLGDLLSFFSDTRRVRRKLQPLNELALAAENLAYTPISDDARIEDLEQAIERATVESPQISTGNADLKSIEVALNGLLRQMQESRAQQMRFVSDASHELRTPIAVIQGYVNMLDRWGASDETVLAESIEALKAESEHMQELVEQLLFLARGDSGRTTLQKVPVNFADMVREVFEESEMVDQAHAYVCGLTEADASDPRFQASCDLALVKQSMRTIVQNAQKYSPEGSTITLSAKYGPDWVAFSVQDEGVGMKSSDVGHVFDRFYRADGTRTSSEGSGLGLSIAKWIVDAHGGSIDVLTREGIGTRFTVKLPK